MAEQRRACDQYKAHYHSQHRCDQQTVFDEDTPHARGKYSLRGIVGAFLANRSQTKHQIARGHTTGAFCDGEHGHGLQHDHGCHHDIV